jgi:hypothetical protein
MNIKKTGLSYGSTLIKGLVTMPCALFGKENAAEVREQHTRSSLSPVT